MKQRPGKSRKKKKQKQLRGSRTPVCILLFVSFQMYRMKSVFVKMEKTSYGGQKTGRCPGSSSSVSREAQEPSPPQMGPDPED